MRNRYAMSAVGLGPTLLTGGNYARIVTKLKVRVVRNSRAMKCRVKAVTPNQQGLTLVKEWMSELRSYSFQDIRLPQNST
jgi:hypothetical protein